MLRCIASLTDERTGESVRAYRDQVIEGHHLARVHPENFEPATDGPEAECTRYTAEACRLVEGSTTRSASRRSRPRAALAAPASRWRRRTASAASASLSWRTTSASRPRAPGVTGSSGKSTDRYLDQITPGRVAQRRLEEDEDAEHLERLAAIARLAQAEVEAACASWPDDMRWN